MFDLVKERAKLKLPLFVIYDHPSDHPQRFVARLWDLNRPTEVHETAETLEELHAKLPLDGMVWVDRYVHDDPTIVGTWV